LAGVEPERQHYNFTLAILTLAGTAFSLQQTMVFPALTTFQHEFGVSASWATWVLTGFLVSAAVTTPVLGRLGDQYGKEHVLLVSLGLFLAGCIGCAFAWNVWSLIAFRALAGAGGALFPLSFAIIRDEFPPEKMKTGIGLMSAVFGVGGGFGIVLSGVIVDHLSWRWIFILGSIPVAAAIWLIWRFVPESPIKSPSRVDFLGAALLSAALLTLMVGLTQGEPWGWTSARVLGVFALAAGLLVAWGWWETRAPVPMVDMRMLAHRPVLLTNIVTVIAGFALFGCFVLNPAFVEAPESSGYGFGASATEAGFYLLPSSLMLLFAGPLAGVMGRRWGSKWPLAIGMALTGTAALVFSRLHENPVDVYVASAALGLGVGLAFAAMVALIAENVRPTETGIATGVNTVIRMIGAVIGGQIGAAILTAETIGASDTPAESAFTLAFGLSAGAGIAAAAIALTIASRPQLLARRT
jgi:EmrB/QacA subfamily drug resistance transporter